MKNHTSLLELVIMMSLMVACIPLLLALIKSCNTARYTYLQDKSLINKVYFEQVVVQDEDSVDWYLNEANNKYYSEDGRVAINVTGNTTMYYASEGISLLRLNKAAVSALPYIQDDYCPTNSSITGVVQNVYLDAGKVAYPDKSYLDFRDANRSAISFGDANWLDIRRGWRAFRTSEVKKFYEDAGLSALDSKAYLYLVWDAHHGTWVLTPINWRLSY